MTIDLAKLDILPDAGSKEGFANALASKVPGGMQLMPEKGSIRRDITVGLAALRRLAVLNANGTLSKDRTIKLRRYILGLALVAITAPLDPYLRQGCNLVPDGRTPRDFKVVNLDGTRSNIEIAHNDAVAYARSAMNEFGIGPNREERFDASLAEKAAEAKPDKLKGDVVSVDMAGRTFKLKVGRGKEAEVIVNDATVIKKGKEPATFDEVVTVGATVKAEVLNNIAVAIDTKK
jgi:CRISPR-associated protein Csb1